MFQLNLFAQFYTLGASVCTCPRVSKHFKEFFNVCQKKSQYIYVNREILKFLLT